MVPSHAVHPKRPSAEAGFSLLEVMVAIIVLTIGLMSGAFLMAHIYKLTNVSRYMALAAQLASEELEDLNRYPANANSNPPNIDPHIQVPAGSNTCGDPQGMLCIGSLTADYPPAGQSVVIQGMPVAYYDSVSLGTSASGTGAGGAMTETYKKTCTNSLGAPGNYIAVQLMPNGTPPPWPANCATTASAALTFDRRWVIEQDQPVVGLRRITVKVILDDASAGMYVNAAPGQQPPPPVTFQMSMVRP